MSKWKKNGPKRDVAQEVTDQVREALEAGTAPWVRPWSTSGVGMPRNAGTGHVYRGINTLIATMAQGANGHSTPLYLSFDQARTGFGEKYIAEVERNGEIVQQVRWTGGVKKGAKSIPIVWYGTHTKKAKEDGEKDRTFRVMKHFNVFNIDDIAMTDEQRQALLVKNGFATVAPDPIERNAACEATIASTGAVIKFGGPGACYNPVTDEVYSPDPDCFVDGGAYYSTVFHELGHRTGHPKRLGRFDLSSGARFGSKDYAFEELVAELTSAFLCARHGVDGKLQHAEYIGHWIQKLKSDKNALFRAASLAREASEYIMPLDVNDEQAEAAE